MAERAVITGLGAVSPLGDSVATSWDALLAGRSALGPITGSDGGGLAPPRAARVEGPDAMALGVDARSARIMGRPALMMLQAGREAMARAGLTASDHAAECTAFFAALGMVDPEPDDLRRTVMRARRPDGIDYGRFFADAYREIYPLWPLAMLNNVGFCLAAQRLGALGENAVFSPGADATLLALVEAAAAVVEGRADVALAAGASESVCARSLARARLARRGRDRDGMVTLGEAAAVLVVEAESRARSRNAHPLAAIAGWGFGFGAPAEEAARDAVVQALERAALGRCEIGAVLLAGEGRDEAGDGAERRAIAGLFDGGTAPALLTSKPLVGDAGPGGAAFDIVLAAMLASTGEPPATLGAVAARHPQGVRSPNDLWRNGLRHVIVNARSPSGQMASLVMARAE